MCHGARGYDRRRRAGRVAHPLGHARILPYAAAERKCQSSDRLRARLACRREHPADHHPRRRPPSRASCPTRARSPAPRNVLMVVLDDVGFAQLGCFGSGIATPNIDRLAAEGLRYNRFHVTVGLLGRPAPRC